MREGRKIRVLQVVGGLSRAGTETWLRNVFRRADPDGFTMTFLVHDETRGAYEDEICALGGQVVRCMGASRPWQYARNLAALLRRRGPFDVVHSHIHHYSGIVLAVAAAVGVPVRIAHSHQGPRAADARPLRLLYTWPASRLIWRYSTVRLAASEQAALALFGRRWQLDARCRVHPCGIDLAPFRAKHDRAAVRAELGIPQSAFVLGHVGRFEAPKNHAFILEVAVELLRLRRQAALLLVGDGGLRPRIERAAREKGIRDRILFTGARRDVARLMVAMDAFVFPSHFEGLGLAAVEAQAAGLPVVASDALPREMVAVPEFVRWLSLEDSPSTWAEAVLSSPPVTDENRRSAVRFLERGSFDVETSAEDLFRLYEAHVGRTGLAAGSAHV